MTQTTRTSILALLLGLSLTSCGSTLQTTNAGAGGDALQAPGSDGLGVVGDPSLGESGSPDGSVAGPGGGVLTGPGSVGAGGTSGGTSTGSGTAAGPGSGSGPAVSGGVGPAAAPGKPIRIGITVADNAALAAAFGREARDAGAPKKKIIDYMNKTGGIAGRKIEAVFTVVDSSADSSTNGQRACDALTQDTKVDIVINTGVLGEVLPACLGKAGVSMLDIVAWSSDAVDASRFRNWFQPVAMRVDRQFLAMIDVSLQRGVLKKGDKLGVLVEDCPWASRVFKNTIEPEAKKAGVTLEKGTYRCVQNIATDLGPVANDIQRETLRFASSGVTHVMVLGVTEAFAVAQFTDNASQQNYLPKYIVGSNAYPWGNSQSDAIISISPDALPNMSGVGYMPLFDVGANGRPSNGDQKAAQDRCKAADPTEGGAATEDGSGKYFTRNNFYLFCDTAYATKALLEANGVRFGLTDVTRGYQVALRKLGSASLGGGYFDAGNRLDGAGLVRPFAYDTKRKTFDYVGGAIQRS